MSISRLYREKIEDLSMQKLIPILSDVTMGKALTAADILITAESSVGMEALPFYLEK